MQTKFIEVRDKGTRIPVVAMKLDTTDEKEKAFYRSQGFGSGDGYVLLARLDAQELKYDSYAWSSYRTMPTAHRYLEEHFDEVPNYSVLDVRVILGEAEQPAPSEIWGGLYSAPLW